MASRFGKTGGVLALVTRPNLVLRVVADQAVASVDRDKCHGGEEGIDLNRDAFFLTFGSRAK